MTSPTSQKLTNCADEEERKNEKEEDEKARDK